MQKLKNEVLKIFMDLIKINSESGNENKVADFIIDYLKRIGVKVFKDNFGNVIAKTRGRGEPVILCAHMDTVWPGKDIKPMIKNGIIKSDGRTILGADDKAGIASILYAIKSLEGKKNRPTELVFTVKEEIGCVGAKNLDYKNLRAKKAIVIDSSSPCGCITLVSPNIFSFSGKIFGKMAHSRSPEEGISAINCFAEFIKNFKPGRVDRFCVSNIGVVTGGEGSNVICDDIFFKGEIRAINEKKIEKEIMRLKKILKKSCQKFAAKFKLEKVQEVKGYHYEKKDELVKFVSLGIERAGLKLTFEKRMGATDANVFCEKGIKALSIGHGRKNCHSVKENITIKNLAKTTKIILELCKFK